MKIEIGAIYKVVIDDCCVRGSFTSKLIKAQDYNHDDELYDTETISYGTELTFENGVRLTAWNGVSLEKTEEC